jgi:hypothetical protein
MKKRQTGFIFISILVYCLLLSCASNKPDKEDKEDPCTQNEKPDGAITYTGNSGGNRPLPPSPYGYEIWTEGGNDNQLTWYGADQGGGAAFRAEWNRPRDFLGRVGYFWNEGKPYSSYNDLFCDFNYTRSPNGTAGAYSYLGIYGWSRDPMIEWYIVEDWFGNEIMGASSPDLNSSLGFDLPRVYTSLGRALVIIRAGSSPGELCFSAYGENLKTGKLHFTVK